MTDALYQTFVFCEGGWRSWRWISRVELGQWTKPYDLPPVLALQEARAHGLRAAVMAGLVSDEQAADLTTRGYRL